jgi:hypothetical protein
MFSCRGNRGFALIDSGEKVDLICGLGVIDF